MTQLQTYPPLTSLRFTTTARIALPNVDPPPHLFIFAMALVQYSHTSCTYIPQTKHLKEVEQGGQDLWFVPENSVERGCYLSSGPPTSKKRVKHEPSHPGPGRGVVKMPRPFTNH